MNRFVKFELPLSKNKIEINFNSLFVKIVNNNIKKVGIL